MFLQERLRLVVRFLVYAPLALLGSAIFLGAAAVILSYLVDLGYWLRMR